MHLTSIASTWDSESNTNSPEIRVELALNGDEAKRHFETLEKSKEEIERALGFPLVWHNPENKKACRIYVRISADFLKPELWPEQHQWLKEKLEIFYKVFGPLARNL
jgi:hypothetical protein